MSYADDGKWYLEARYGPEVYSNLAHMELSTKSYDNGVNYGLSLGRSLRGNISIELCMALTTNSFPDKNDTAFDYYGGRFVQFIEGEEFCSKSLGVGLSLFFKEMGKGPYFKFHGGVSEDKYGSVTYTYYSLDYTLIYLFYKKPEMVKYNPFISPGIGYDIALGRNLHLGAESAVVLKKDYIKIYFSAVIGHN